MKSPPGRCWIVAAAVGLGLLAALFAGRADAEPKKKPAPESNNKGAPKEKTYTFGGLDIDGKLKTPQLLYFLNRMKSEFDTTTPDKRSFIPELKRSTDEM